MIITRTPYRISFFGGGTDYPVYYKEHGGTVLNATVNKYCYIMCRYLPPFFDHRYWIRYARQEATRTVEEIQHPSVRECLKFMEIDKGVEVAHSGDIPAMSGIGSSSAFTVGFLHALYALRGEMVTRRTLAFEAVHVEQDLIGESVGSQDQFAAAFGGLNRIEFRGQKDIFVHPLPLTSDMSEYLQSCIMLYFTGLSREASTIAETQIRETPKKLKELHRMREMVDEAVNILNGDVSSLADFGKLLHESWLLKRGLTPLISTRLTDEIYETAMRAGAIGGKLCGAGGGGFMLLFVPPEKQPAVKEVLKDLLLVPLRFENLGSHVVFYST